MAVLREWDERYFAQCEAPQITRARLERAAHSFFKFLNLDESLKEPIKRTLNEQKGDENRIDIGYMRRRAQHDGDQEEKMYFHYHPDIDTLFQADIERAGEKAGAFMREARAVWDETVTIARPIVDEFETRWPGVRDRFFPKDAHPYLVIRFLAYDARGMGEFLAKAHYDRGDFTIALGESAPGLRIGMPGDLHEVEHTDGYVVVMPGTGFPQDIDPTITPAWHDVVQKPEAQFSGQTARWAIVGFFDVVDKQYIPIEATHVPRT